MSKTVFISYCRVDIEWKRKIENSLKILRFERIPPVIWSDENLYTGEHWKDTLNDKLENAEIALLIVTKSFISSEFIRQKELPTLRRRERDSELTIMPLLVESCNYILVPELEKLNFRPRNRNTFEELKDTELSRELTELNNEIILLLKKTPPFDGGSRSHPSSPPADNLPPFERDFSVTLELTFKHLRKELYFVELSLSNPDPQKNISSFSYRATIPLRELEQVMKKKGPIQYSQLLEQQLFPSGSPRQTCTKNFHDEKKEGVARIRINIDPTARDLHAVRWDTLPYSWRDQKGDYNKDYFVSHHVCSCTEYWSAASIKPRPPQMSIATATLGVNLTDGDCQFLEERQKHLEQEGIKCSPLMKFDNLSDLGTVNASVLSLIIAPTNDVNNPGFIIKNEDDVHNPVCNEEELRDEVRKMRHKPQIITIECAPIRHNETPNVDDKIIQMIASSLPESGICAVIFRQADMSDDAWKQFLLAFLTSIQKHGNIDKAHHQARVAILNTGEVWKADLITRLRTGAIWYQPRFLDNKVDVWNKILKSYIEDGFCIPVIGPGISDYLIQSREEVARRWADECNYPLASLERGVLRKIAQYVGTSFHAAAPEEQYLKHIIKCAVDRYGPGNLPKKPRSKDLYDYMSELWHEEIAKYPQGELGPYQLLAKLRAPIYFTTTFNNFLSVALSSQEKIETRDRILSLEEGMSNYYDDSDDKRFVLDGHRPLVYHLFGRLDRDQHHNNLILSEDQHFDFLLKFNENWNALPWKVRGRFSESSLLFLGFHLDSWDFRILFRAIQAFEGNRQLRKIPHVAVQIDPDDDRIKDPERTRDYLIAHFSQISINAHIYFGSAHDFLKQLDHELNLEGLHHK